MMRSNVRHLNSTIIGVTFVTAFLTSLPLISAEFSFTTTNIENPDIQEAPTRFGININFVGDVTGDGVDDFSVGANFWNDSAVQKPGGTGNPQNVGRAFVFSGADQSFVYSLDDPIGQEFGKFGRTDGAGDVNNDGVPDIVTSSYWRTLNDNTQTSERVIVGAGQAFIHSGVDGSVIRTLDDPFPEKLALFGCYTVGIGDLNNDGIDEQMISTPLSELDGDTDVGELHIFSGADGSLIRTLIPDAPRDAAKFGLHMADAGDINGDDIPDIIVGAPGQNRAYVFSGATGDQLFVIDHPAAQLGHPKFGRMVAGGLDVSGDGVSDILVGAPLQDVGDNTDQGAVYVFSGVDGSLLRTIDNPIPQAHAHFGISPELVDDMSGDGLAEMLVGSPNQDVNGILNVGQAFLFSGSNGSLVGTLNHPIPEAYANFGHSVESGDVTGDGVADLFVGSPYQDDIDDDEEELHVHMDQGLVTLFITNSAPVADAGEDQDVAAGSFVRLDGTDSLNPLGEELTYRWIQTSGTQVNLRNRNKSRPLFTAPQVATSDELNFLLTITSQNGSSSTDLVQINIL